MKPRAQSKFRLLSSRFVHEIKSWPPKSSIDRLFLHHGPPALLGIRTETIWSQKPPNANMGELKHEHSRHTFSPQGKTSLSVHLSRRSTWLSIDLTPFSLCSMHLATVLVSACQPFHLSVLSIWLIFYSAISFFLTIYLTVGLPDYLSLYLSICLSIYQSILSFFLSFYLPILTTCPCICQLTYLVIPLSYPLLIYLGCLGYLG